MNKLALILLSFTLVTALPTCWGFKAAPEQIELIAAGSASNPYFLPKTLELKQGKYYQVVIKNPLLRRYTFYLAGTPKALITHKVLGSAGMNSQSVIIPPGGTITWHLTANQPGLYTYYESSSMNREVLTEGVLVIVPEENAQLSEGRGESDTTLKKKLAQKMMPQQSTELQADSNQAKEDDLVYIPYGPGPIKRFINKMKGKPTQYNF